MKGKGQENMVEVSSFMIMKLKLFKVFFTHMSQCDLHTQLGREGIKQ